MKISHALNPLPFTRFVALIVPLLCLPPAFAQRPVALAENDTPVSPLGLANRPLPDGAMEFATAEEKNIRAVVIGEGLIYPWALEFLPDGSLLVTERTGNLRIIRDGILDPEPVPGGPDAVFRGNSGEPGSVHGYMDIALHPQFADNGYIYLTYSKPMGEGSPALALARGRWTGEALTDVTDIFMPEGIEGASRIAFGHDGTLFMTTGGNDPQDPDTYGGKVLRLNDDGSVPSDNPFVGREGHKPEVYSLGHRTSLSLAVHPQTGDVWQTENGQNGGDELNLIRPGVNYGWPIVSYGRDYTGPWHSEGGANHEDFEPPLVFWMPSVAPSGLLFYTGDAFANWKGDIFVGALRTGQIPGTGHIERIVLNERLEEMRRESLLVELRQRIRDIGQGPDGLLYMAVDAEQGAILRIEPAT